MLLVLLVFLTILVLVLLLLPYRDKFTQPNIVYTNIGNILSDYFYTTYAKNNHYIIPNTTPEIKQFLECIIKNDIRPVKPLPSFSNSIESDKWIQRNTENFLDFWQMARPYIRKVYDKSIPESKKNVSYPVIHFRCSDIPFNRHFMYHLPKFSTVNEVINVLLARSFNKVIWLNCNKHLSTGNNCDDINNLYISLFEKKGIQVIKQCNSILDDFYLMIYSPLLVSLNSSSFSFMAGISKNPGDYVSCNMGLEENGKYKLQKDADWMMIMNEPLLHKNVIDYYNINELKLKLEDRSN